MTTFATALKDEIRRVARKEIRANTAKHAKAIARYRKEIARLKRQQKEQEKRLHYLSADLQKQPKPASNHQENGNLRFSARSVRAQRRRTGLSAAEYAKLIGVSPLTIYNWEQGKSRPRNGQFQQLVAIRGIGKREAQAKIEGLRVNSGLRRGKRKPK